MIDDTVTSAPADAGPTLRFRTVLHQVHPGPRAFPLAQGTVALGRAPADGGLAFPDDPAMSRTHATLTLSGDRLELVDAGSHNGAFVNTHPVRRALLADGDVLRLGDGVFVVRYEPIDLVDARIAGIDGQSPAVRSLRAELARFAPTSATVLLTGETGTGKTTAARAIHALSGRKGPFVHVNAATIHEQTAESALFGHKAGAFTDARTEHAGWFQAAHRGTLFLDELALLPPSVQGRLLVAVESGAVTPLGATRPVPVDVRIVVATNEDLGQALSAGRFRADLYARLAEIVVNLPPLRARREDVLPLFRRALGEELPITPALAERLVAWSWPFNVREVEKLAAELRLRADGEALGTHLLGGRLELPADAPSPQPSPPSDLDRPPDRDALIAMLQSVSGNVSELARQVGRSSKQIYRWCAKHGVDPSAYR